MRAWLASLVVTAVGCGDRPRPKPAPDDAADHGASTYIKALNADPGDTFGSSLALSADGTTLAIGAPQEASNATGVGGDPANNATQGAGAAYVYTHVGDAWTLEAYVKASNPAVNDQFGAAVALSADGSTLAVGARTGAVYVFTRTGDAWTQAARVKAAPFGASVALSGDGATLAVGAEAASAAYVFTRRDAWAHAAYIQAPNTRAGDAFGHSVSLSGDGATLAVGAHHEASGLADNAADHSMSNAGAAYVFTRSGDAWRPQAYVKAAKPALGDLFGASVSLAADGATLAVGAEGALVGKGAAFVFARAGDAWRLAASLRPSNAGGDFGASVALSADGNHLAAGAFSESSGATGLGGNQASTAATYAGATYVFARANQTWTQLQYVKALNTDARDFFGMAVGLSRDGGTLAVGAPLESSWATGINGDQADNRANEAGAVYVYQ